MQREASDARRLKLTVEYDGAAYKGWQRQIGLPSVQGAIERAIFQLTSETEDELEMRVAGRTDAGVHAMGQVCSVLTRYDWQGRGDHSDDESDSNSCGEGESKRKSLRGVQCQNRGRICSPAIEFGRLLNTRLPPDIAVVQADEVSLDWVPYKCLRKRYRYRIFASRYTEPVVQVAAGKASKDKNERRRRLGPSGLAKRSIGRQYVWQCPWALSLELMQRGATALEGEHDFTSFCHSSEKENDNIINVESINVIQLDSAQLTDATVHTEASVSDAVGDMKISDSSGTLNLALDFVSHGFRMHMVRNLVGMLVDIGRGARRVEELDAIFEAKDRTSAIVGESQGAPAHGLSLISVDY